MSGKLKVSPTKIAGPNDPIYRRGPQVFVPAARPTTEPAQTPSHQASAGAAGKWAANKRAATPRGPSTGTRPTSPHYGTWIYED